MQILDPNEIKDTKKQSVDQGQRLIHAISTEEARLNKSISILREEAKVETEKIKTETDAFIREQKERAETMVKEVASLESRREEALKPINDIRIEAETYLIEAKQALGEAKALEEQAKANKDEIIELAEDLKDRESEILDRERKLTNREQRIAEEEKQTRLGTISLSDKWVEFHEKVNEANSELEKRESRILDREKVLDIRDTKQHERETLQDQHDRVIKDRYETLERSVDEVKKWYNKNI